MTSDAARTYDADLRALIDRAVQAHQAGRLEEAEALYGQVLAQRPDEPNALGNLGLIRLHRGDLEAGVQLIDASLAARPNQPWALTNKASALIALRRLEEAADCCRLAVEMDAASVVGHDVLGDVLLQLGRPEQALAAYGEAIALRPDHADALFKSGSILLDLGRWAEAEPALRRAAEHAPHSALPHSRLSMLLRALGRLDEALAEGDRAVARDPANVEVRIQRAGVLREIGRPHEALEALEAVLQDHPRHADALMTKAIVLGDLRREREALTIFDAVEAENPAYPRLKWIRCLAHLMLGRYEEGWAGHEDRLRDIQRGAANRQWLGGPVEGKTVVVHAEQGLGDTLQMVRYIPLLAERGARVILMVHAPLLALARSVKGAAEVISLHDPIPPFDLQCAAMSLPYAFGTRVETIPAQVPYLEAPEGKIAAWTRRLNAETPDAGLRVGLIWSGGHRPEQPETWAVNRRRNIPLRRLAPLKTPGVTFYSLQKGEAAEAELAEVKAGGWDGPDIVDWANHLHDVADTAALMECMDLVISVDTSMAHLAGALARPVWILNRYDSCWRWLQDRPDSPWYPTARLFRQSRFDDWTPVIAEVAQGLAALASQTAARGPGA